MTNISKHPLNPKTEAQLTLQFNALFAKTPSGGRGELYTALFTPTERIMFIKRLAIILLLSRKCPTYTISKMLFVSDATVRAIHVLFKNGQYDSIVGVMRKKSFDGKGFLKMIEIILQAGLPPRGRGRWKWLYEMEDTPTIRRLLKKQNRT